MYIYVHITPPTKTWDLVCKESSFFLLGKRFFYSFSLSGFELGCTLVPLGKLLKSQDDTQIN